MFENLIKFKANDKFIKHNQDNLPVPAKLNTPDWFKKLIKLSKVACLF